MSRVSAVPPTYPEWFGAAVAILQEKHDAKPSAVRPRTWVNWYVQGMSPEEAAQRAATEAYNALPAGKRLLRRHPAG
jgi:hypothetical protein